MSISFIVPGKPVGKGRPRVGKRGAHAVLYTPTATVNYEGLIAHAAMAAMAGAPLFEGPVGCELTIHCAVPQSWSGKKQRSALASEILPTSKPDIDNVVKAIFDGCNGVQWRDDVLVVELAVRKRYAATPGVYVKAWALVERVAQADLMGMAE